MARPLLKPKALVFALLAPVLAGAKPGEAPALNSAIDLSPAVRIGDFSSSEYLFEKAYALFAETSMRRTKQPPDRDAKESWFRLYLGQQLIKADLADSGALEGPEVKGLTAQMARYMLIQPRGVLYQQLGGADLVAYRHERRARILRECGFSADPASIARLWAAVAPRFALGIKPSDADVASIAPRAVANYSFAGAPRQITALDFVQDFESAIARAGPHGVRDLTTQIEDMAVAEYDFAEAKKLRLDQTPQFLEDRRNFALNQALYLYEKEVLTPRIAVSAEELAARYRAEIERYRTPTEVRGELLIADDPGSLNRLEYQAAGAATLLVIRRDDPVALPGIPYSALLALPVGRRLGPFPYGGKYAVFFKRGIGELAPEPFARVKSELEREITREKMDALERDRLDREAARIQLGVDPSRYGLRTPDGVKTAF